MAVLHVSSSNEMKGKRLLYNCTIVFVLWMPVKGAAPFKLRWYCMLLYVKRIAHSTT